MKIEKATLNANKTVKEQLEKKVLECSGEKKINNEFVNKYFSVIQQAKMGARIKMDEFEGAILDNGLCGIDCSSYNMSELSQEEFERIPFDSNTTFSAEQIEQFHPDSVLENAKSFGLGIENIDTDLSGIHIAIIDQSFDYNTVDAKVVEYMGSDVANPENEERYHGKTVTSLMVSNSCGITKNASVHFFSNADKKRATSDYLDEIIKYNKNNIENGKKSDCIIVVSISKMLSNEVFEQYQLKLRENGCELVCANNYNIDFHAFRNGNDYIDTLLMNEEQIETTFGGKINKELLDFCKNKMKQGKNAIKIPINRTYHQTGSDSECYKYQALDSTSWGIPQVAGLLAILKKQRTDLTYEEFVEIARSTAKGDEHIINPEEMQREIESQIEPISTMKKLTRDSLGGENPVGRVDMENAEKQQKNIDELNEEMEIYNGE